MQKEKVRRMKREEFKPYLRMFISAVLEDGSERSGYISNYDDFEHGTSDDINLVLVNGFYTESVPIARVVQIKLPAREDTVSIPVVDWKNGYSSEKKSD